MSACTKWAARADPTLPALSAGELAFFRFAAGLAFLLLLAFVSGRDLLGADRRGLWWRGLSGGLASTSFFLGLQYTSLTHATLLNYTFVIWGPLFATFALGEQLGWRGGLAVLAALCGVLLVIHPEAGQIRSGDLIALFSGVMAGTAVVQIRRLRQGESSSAIFFYFNLCGLPIALASLPLAKASFVVPAFVQWPALLAIGVTSIAGQLLMTYGYRELTAAQGSLITLSAVLYTALLAFLLFHDPLTPTTLLGGALILASAVGITSGSPPSRFRSGGEKWNA
jgi:drug/metabolite transporter (DMT)-like permease